MRPIPGLPVLLVLCMALSGPARAQDDFDADRPDFSTGPRSLPPHRWQLETGWTRVERGSTCFDTAGEALLRHALTPSCELRVSLPTWNRFASGAGPVSTGFGDAGAGLKVTLPGASDALVCGVVAEATVPSGAHDFRGDGAGADLVLAATRDLGRAGALTGNLGWRREDQVNGLLATASWGRDLPLRLGGYGEWAMLDAGGQATQRYDAGLTRLVAPWTQLDARLGLAWIEGRRETTFGCGVSQRW